MLIHRASCQEYFSGLYDHIRASLRGQLQLSWETARIEFIFSVPTTWGPNPTVERFKQIIYRAGFGARPTHPRHSAVIGLTEAEAAAVYTAKITPGSFQVRAHCSCKIIPNC